MHHLVPPFIIEKYRQNDLSGSFSCAALFVDISGFTSVTEALMKHGQYGAEVLAVVMRTVFTPLVHSVYEQGGFVTGFAGDAFTAVFPTGINESPPQLHALATAWHIQHEMISNSRQETRFGIFEFSAKVGLASGTADWGIVSSENGDQATYYFSGSAIDGCARSESHASSGEIIAGNAFYEVIQPMASASAVNDHWRIRQISGVLPNPKPVIVPAVDADLAAHFVPLFLVKQGIEGEFRQILNLFIGLKGTPSQDELVIFMQHVFRLQEQFGGFLNRIDFGDKGCHLLLFWGAPISRENDLTHVLDFILALDRATDISLRAGITYRIAHAGYIGSELAEEYTCYGRGVNLAARQMTSAAWGDIWLDGETAQRASADFEVKSVGPKAFKGFAEPQNVYQLEGHLAKRRSRFEDKPLIGRQRELETLVKAVGPIFNGRFAGSVAIIGEAGVGKSRLVDALYTPYIQQDQAAVFLCQADELLRQSLNPFRYFLARYFNQSPLNSEKTNKERFFAKFRELLDATPESALKEELERTHSFLGNLIDLSWKDSLYEQLDPELRFENALEGLKALFKAESMRRPVIIHLEDAHWWDQDSQTFLTRLTRNVKKYPFVLLVTSRQDLPEGIFEPTVPQQQIQLQTLGQSEVGELAKDMLNRTASPPLLKLLVDRTEGNPFFVEQILLYLQEHDLLDAAEAETEQALSGTVHIPTDVRAVLTARLDRLPVEIKDLAQKASILGHEFEIPILAAMVDRDLNLDLFLAAGEAEKVWLNSGPASYVFRHALLRDAAYDMQVGSRLRQLHSQAAYAHETVYPDPVRAPHFAEIAFHFDRAERAPEAQRYYGSAGEFAKDEYRNEDAVTFLSRALELADETDHSARYQYLATRETIYQWLGQRDRQEHDLAQLSELLVANPDNLALADLALRKSSFDLIRSGYEVSVSHVREALAHAEAAQDTLTEARAYHRWGRTLWQQGQSDEARTHLEKALKSARRAHDQSLAAECLVDLANVLRLQGHFNRARRILKEATEIFDQLKDAQGVIRCQTLVGVLDTDLGFFADSEASYLRALNLSHETGWRFAETYIFANMGGTQFELGDFAKSSDYLNQALHLAEETGDLRSEANSLDTLGLIAHYSGQPGEAVSTYYERAISNLQSLNNQRELGFVLTHAGYALIDLARFDQAEAYLRQALLVRQEIGAIALQIDTLAGIARLALATGRIDQAVSITQEILAHIDESGIDGIELPILVHLICYQVLIEGSKQDPDLQKRAEQVLETGNVLLDERLQRLPDEDTRQRFLQNPPYNRQLRDLRRPQKT